MRLSPADRRPGMSLLEVLGATAIFLISIVAIGELMSLSTEQAIDVQNRTRATRLCQSKLNEFTTGVESVDGQASGDFEEEPSFRWEANVVSESSALNLYRVTVKVTRDSKSGGEPLEVSMTQMLYKPSEKGQLPASSASSSEPSSSTGTTPGATTGSSSTGSTGGSTTPASGGANTGNTGNTGGGTGGGKK